MNQEMKPGEVREMNNRKYQAILSKDDCNGCAFENVAECDLASSALGECCRSGRTDNEFIIFVNVTEKQ